MQRLVVMIGIGLAACAQPPPAMPVVVAAATSPPQVVVREVRVPSPLQIVVKEVVRDSPPPSPRPVVVVVPPPTPRAPPRALAQGPCKGRADEAVCKAFAACAWTAGYETRTGARVAPYCKAKAGARA